MRGGKAELGYLDIRRGHFTQKFILKLPNMARSTYLVIIGMTALLDGLILS